MKGLMMNAPLLITGIMAHGLRTYPDKEIVTNLVEGGTHRYSFADAGKRIAKAAHMLVKLGIKEGDRVGVMGWNTHRQFELYYAISCIGAVCHTINPRLGPENAAYVMTHAGDKLVLFDTSFAPLVNALAPHLKTVKNYVALTDRANHPSGVPAGTLIYEELIAGEKDSFDWPELDENAACGLCYTSGTTGKPKGVLFSHRGVVLHTLVTSLPSSFGVDATDCLLPVVPMFHVNAWGIPYSAFMMGTKLVLPGPGMDGESLHRMITEEGVTYSLGVPTVWLGLLQYVNSIKGNFGKMKYTLVGGAALSEHLIRGFDAHGVGVRQGWGMTEMSPTGTVNKEDPEFANMTLEERIPIQLRQGRPIPFIELRLVTPEGKILPHDGVSSGHLQTRGPWVLSDYYNYDGQTLTEDGWFDTGDVSVIHPDGRMQITDRSKDVIKSGGEWISTIDIENTALLHADVVQAAVIGVEHPRWLERPLLIVQLADGKTTDPEDIRQFVCGKMDKISWPDAVEIVDEIPLGATGKVLKTKLREMFKDYVLPELREGGAKPSKKNRKKSFTKEAVTTQQSDADKPRKKGFSFFGFGRKK